MQHPPTAARPQRAAATIALVLRQRDLQPHLPREADRRAVAQTCSMTRNSATGDVFTGTRGALYALARQFQLLDANYRALLMRMATLHDPGVHGPLERLLADCRDVIWASDAHLGRQPAPPHELPPMDAERRRQCIAYLWAVRHDGTMVQGLLAVDVAREPDRVNFYALLALEIAQATLMCAQLGFCGLITFRGAVLAAQSMHGFRSATWLGKAKSLAFAGLGGAMVGAGVLLANLVVGRHAELRQDVARDRATTFAGVRGRDLLLCELITGRRYRGPGL